MVVVVQFVPSLNSLNVNRPSVVVAHCTPHDGLAAFHEFDQFWSAWSTAGWTHRRTLVFSPQCAFQLVDDEREQLDEMLVPSRIGNPHSFVP